MKSDTTAIRDVTARLAVRIRRAAAGREHGDFLAAVTGLRLPGLERWIVHSIPGSSFVPASQVAADLGVALAPLSRACRRLEEAGHLVRLDDPRDRRRTLVGLTDSTAEAMRRWDEEWPRPYLEAVQGWDPGDLATLGEWLATVTAAWRERFGTAWAPPRSQSSVGMAAPTGRFLTDLKDFVAVVGRTDDVRVLLSGTGLEAATEASVRILDALSIGGPATASDVAALQDADTSLTRRQLADLRRRGWVDVDLRDDGGRERFRLAALGAGLLDELRRRRREVVPVPGGRLVACGLPHLVEPFAAALLDGPSATSAA